MIRDIQSYRQHARQTYEGQKVSDNPDEAQRSAFTRPAPGTEVYSPRLATKKLDAHSFAIDRDDFVEQHNKQAEQYIFVQAPAAWAHRHIYAYVDAYAVRTLVVYIADRIKQPIQLHTLFGQSTTADQYDSCIVILADDAQATFIDRYHATDGTHVRSIVYHVGARAQLTVVYDHASQQQALMASGHLFRCARDSNVTVQCVLGSGIRTDVWFDIFLTETGAQATVRGVYAFGGRGRLNMVTEQQHNAPHTTSEITLNGCLSGHAQATYHGRIHIDHAAQHAVAQQRNHTLLLADTARAVSIPSLEALAHEVHCVHASAVGTVDKQAIAYLVARGIPFEHARMLIVQGFMHTSMGACSYLESAVRKSLQVLTTG